MIILKTIKKKIYLLFLLVLQIGYYNTPCFANNTPIISLKELFTKHNIDKIESDLQNFSLEDREEII